MKEFAETRKIEVLIWKVKQTSGSLVSKCER